MKILIRMAASFLLVVASSIATPCFANVQSWTERVRISGSADLGFFGGGRESVTSDDGFDIWDTRLFVDAELAESIAFGDTPAVRNIGFTFEWNIVRNGSTANDVGLAYIDFEGVHESPWLNLRVGRFQIPFGESYKLYSKGYADRTFVQQPLGGPWWWDEGVLLHGSAANGKFGYLASVTNGDNDFNDAGGGLQATLKFWTQPLPWLYVSASGLFTDKLHDVDGALWLGEGWARSVGSGGPPLPNFTNGVPLPDDPDGLGHTWAIGLDVIAKPVEGVRVWLAGGRYDLESNGSSVYDRELWYWITELEIGGEVFSSALHPLFLGFRADGVGTWDGDRGYLLDVRYTGAYGYNMKSIIAYTAVFGWRLGEYVTLRGEYSIRDVKLVRGAGTGLLPESTGNENVYSIEFGLHF
jgi:hypothetical protein